MTDILTIRRQLKIRSGAVQRLLKETKLYRKEIDDLEKRKSKLITDGAEEWDVKNVSKMVDESKRMVDDTTSRLDKASVELDAVITSAKEKSELNEDEELLKAEKLLQETKG